MINRSHILKISGILLAEIIILALLFTGTVVISSKNNASLNGENSIKFSDLILDVETSNNFIYVVSTNNYTSGIANITKYDTNFHLINSFRILYNTTFSPDILAATDQNVLINNGTSYFLLDNQGILTTFKLVHGNTGWYTLPVAFGSNYFITHVHYNTNTNVSLDAYELKSDGTQNHLFHVQAYSSITNNSSAHKPLIDVSNPFYRNPDTIEIAYTNVIQHTYYTQNETFPNIYYTFENFTRILFNINTNSVKLVPSNIGYLYYQRIENSIKNQGSSDLAIFPCGNDYAILERDVLKNKNTEIQIITDTGNPAKLNVSNQISLILTIGLPVPLYNHFIYPSFQIKNKCYLNMESLKVKDYTVVDIIPALLTYTQYTFHSKLSFDNYSDLVDKGYNINYVFPEKIGNNILYFGQAESNNRPSYFFMKLFKIRTNSNIFDFIYTLPLYIKFIIGATFILPTSFYLLKKQNKEILSETYPIR